MSGADVRGGGGAFSKGGRCRRPDGLCTGGDCSGIGAQAAQGHALRAEFIGGQRCHVSRSVPVACGVAGAGA